MPRPGWARHAARVYRPQVQPLPHWHIVPQRHPGLRVPVLFLDIVSSFSAGRLHVSLTLMTHDVSVHYTCVSAPDAETEAEICACISRLASTLKAEYAEALHAIDVQGTSVKAFANERGLSASNAGVRIHRARQALKKRLVESCGTCAEHGCRDCTCRAVG